MQTGEELDTDDVVVVGTTIQTAPGGGTVTSFEARAVYPPAGINLYEIRDGDAPFTDLTTGVDNGNGNASFSKSGVSDTTPCKVARLAPKLVGNAAVAYDLEIYFDNITGSGGSGTGDTQTITYRRGDVNNDGSVSIKDAMFAAQYIAGNRVLSFIEAVNLACVNHDEVPGDKILGSDDMFIAQYRVGLRDAGFNWTG